jgi:transcriptional regulator with XRE-family HTH domain
MPSDLRQLPKKFGSTVRELRTAAGLTQMRLAEKADLALNYVGEIERGEKLVSVETVVRLARALGLTGAELLKRSGL